MHSSGYTEGVFECNRATRNMETGEFIEKGT